MTDPSKTKRESLKRISASKRGTKNPGTPAPKPHPAEQRAYRSQVSVEKKPDRSEECLIVLDPLNYAILGVNETFVNAFGLRDNDAFVGRRFYELTHCLSTPGSPADPIYPLVETLETEKRSTVEHIHYDESGKKHYFELSTNPIIGEGGKIHQIIHLSRDITERKRTEEQKDILADISRLIASTPDIHEIYEQFAAETKKMIPVDSLAINLYDHKENTMSAAYVSGWDIDGRRQGDSIALEGSLSEAVIRRRTAVRIQSESPDEIIRRFPKLSNVLKAGLRSILCVPLLYRDEVIGALHFRSKEPNAFSEQDLRLAERIGEQIAGTIANAQLYAGLKKTEQELKASELRYRELSIIDELTKLYNSRHFYYQLKIEMDRSNRFEQPLTLMMMDLDNFKAFNDAYGHVAGDQVLSRLGQVIKRCVRVTDFSYRYGGEEFTVLLPMTKPIDGLAVAERIREEFRKEAFTPVSGREVRMTMSTGLAQYHLQEDRKAFVHRVDELMYQAKKSGKDRICCESF